MKMLNLKSGIKLVAIFDLKYFIGEVFVYMIENLNSKAVIRRYYEW